MSSKIFEGTIPALMTPCTPERKPDFDAAARLPLSDEPGVEGKPPAGGDRTMEDKR